MRLTFKAERDRKLLAALKKGFKATRETVSSFTIK